MDAESELDRFLTAIAEVYDTERKRYVGVYDHELWAHLGTIAVSRESAQIDRAFEMAHRQKLLRHSAQDWETVILLPAGWRRVPGGMPGHDKDDEFLAAFDSVWRDPSVRRLKGRVMASAVYRSLRWSFDACEAGNISRRLADRGLVEHLEMLEGNALLRLA